MRRHRHVCAYCGAVSECEFRGCFNLLVQEGECRECPPRPALFDDDPAGELEAIAQEASMTKTNSSEER